MKRKYICRNYPFHSNYALISAQRLKLSSHIETCTGTMGMSSESLLNVYIGYIIHLIRAPIIASILFFILQPSYNSLYEYCSQFMSDRIFFTVLLWAVHVICYWAINTFFFICDEYQYLQQYKLPRKKYQIPSKTLIYKTVKSALIGQLLTDPLGVMFIIYPLWSKNSSSTMIYDTSDIDNNITAYFIMIYCKFLVCDICNTWLFYIAHRALHNKYLYGKIHKQHHEYNGTISFAAEYAHPIEGILANSIPTLIGGIIVGAHPLQFALWLAWRLQETYESHSGYAFYGTFLHKIGLTNADSALFHDFHHSKNIGNYSGIQCDALFGTDNGWNEWYKNWVKQKNEEIKEKCQ